jgi:Na+-translocating ferredoxin:NAD+ oxidoreductase RnfC subunit/Na+-translocating ferredoxin:NAD+ oxidoreductase RnfD subunit
MNVIDSLLSFRKKGYALNTAIHTIVDLEAPSSLNFPLNCRDGVTCSSLVDRGDKLEYGQPIWNVNEKKVFPCPVAGEVVDLVNVPDARGERMVPSITVKPAFDHPFKPFPPLDPQNASVSDLKKRIEETGIQTDRIMPQPLLDKLFSQDKSELKAVVVLAMDREPLTASYFQQYLERTADSQAATRLLGRISGVQKVWLALPESARDNPTLTGGLNNIDPLWIPTVYPETLDPFVIARTGLSDGVAVVSLETTLAAYDAVCHGQIQIKKVLTVVGPDNRIVGNFRVWIGTPFKDVFDRVGLKPGEKDKVVAGGPMRGFAQYSLDGTVDSGINSLMLIPSQSIVQWSTEPCINCGKCVHACPMNLQVQLIGRYSEFSLFARTRDYDIDNCIECGLCATVCTARRPLLQLIDLAKKQLVKAESSEKGATEPGDPARVKGRRVLTSAHNDPALSFFSGLPRFTVGFSPHWRTRASITKMNIAFILAQLPTVIVSAFAQFYGSQAVNLNGSVTSVNPILKALVLEMGLDTGFLWFSGVLGAALFGLGMGILVEYLCQVFLRQPYYATNGHGALMGLLIALLMPPAVPAWILLVAIVMAILVAKQVFGGIGGYPLHPALVGWLVVYLSWPHYVFPIGTASIAGFNSVVIVVTILGGLVLWATGYARMEISLGVVIGTVVFAFLLQSKLSGSIGDQLLTGHVFLAAFFLATDTTSSPVNKLAMWIYGFGIGFLIILIRAFGIWPDAVPFAVLLMNVLSPLLDRIKPKVIKMAT